jgi:hypothetical protein
MKANKTKPSLEIAKTPSRANKPRPSIGLKSFGLLALSLMMLIWVTGSIGQQGPPPAGLMRLWPGYLRGNATSVAVSGNHAYVGLTLPALGGGCNYNFRGWRGRLEVIDVSDPNHPVWLRALDFRGPVVRLQASNEVLYAASGRTLSVFTVTNAAAPLLIGQCETAFDTDIGWFQLRGQYVYAVEHESCNLDVFDISNPGRPILAGSATNSQARYDVQGQVQVAGNYAYVAGVGLQVFDVSVATKPTLLTINGDSPVFAVDVVGDYAYLTTSEGLKIISITNPACPTVVATNALGAYGKRILTSGRYCYVSVGRRLEVFDVANVTQPTSIGSYDPGGDISDLTLAGHDAFVAAAGGLQILDLTNPSSPAFVSVGTRETGGPAEAIQVVGHYAYLADGDSGLQIIDLTDTNGLIRVAQLRTAGYAHAIQIVGTNAYVGIDAGLELIDVSNPKAPARVSALDIGRVEDLQVVSNLAYVAAYTLQIVDVSDSARPRLITNLDQTVVDDVRAVHIAGQFAYVAGRYNTNDNDRPFGLIVVDISHPAQPFVTGFYKTVAPVRDIQIIGQLAYVIASSALEPLGNDEGPSWLQVFDVTNPARPTPLGQCQVTDDAQALQVVGRYAYIAGGSWLENAREWRDGLLIVDVSDPAHPTRVYGLTTPSWGNDLQVVGDEVYLADGLAGLAVANLSLPQTGPLSVAVHASWTNVVVGYSVDLTGSLDGWPAASVWDFGDGTVLSNRLSVSHAWAAPGDYPAVLRAYNVSNPGGVSATVTVHVVTQPVHYVAAGNTNPLPPYTSWATAATNIQDAVDAADAASWPPGSLLVLVSNGVYAAGGRVVGGVLTNRVVVKKPIALRSVNGPQTTVIEGYQVPGTTNGDSAIRCVYLGQGAALSGFTLTKGATRALDEMNTPEAEMVGGGLSGEASAWVSNCVFFANSASREGGGVWGPEAYAADAPTLSLTHCTLTSNSAPRFGGGVFGGILNNCVLMNNSAYEGGGAYAGTLNNCTLTGNSAGRSGGGGQISRLNNCVIYFNSAPAWANYFYEQPYSDVTVNYCCVTPIPPYGVGNITNAPLFVNYAANDLRLQSNSPCINAGKNAFVTSTTDLDGNPRTVRGTVDIGAYEFQGPGSAISYAWLQRYGLPTDGSADFTDLDADGHNTWQEWHCQTDPLNPLSTLRLLSASLDGTNVTVNWQSVAGVRYVMERSTNLSASPPFLPLASGLTGQSCTTSFTDTNAARMVPLFYRVGVQ